jgi:hypothetical protein
MNTHMLSLSGHSRVQLPDDIHQRNTAVYLQLGDAWLRQAAEHATAYAQQRLVLGKMVRQARSAGWGTRAACEGMCCKMLWHMLSTAGADCTYFARKGSA